MKTKTLKLIESYRKKLNEANEEMEGMEGGDPNAQQAQTQPTPTDNEVMPLTSRDEDEYISNIIDAALFEPSPEEARSLRNLQSVMSMKRYTNAREEILPTVLAMISSKSQEGSLKKDLASIE